MSEFTVILHSGKQLTITADSMRATDSGRIEFIVSPRWGPAKTVATFDEKSVATAVADRVVSEHQPRFQLDVGNKIKIDDPSDKQIEEHILWVVRHHDRLMQDYAAFVILHNTCDADQFIQAGINADGADEVSYKDGPYDYLYRACNGVDLADLIAIFQEYARGADSWKHYAQWEKWPIGE